MASIMHCRDGVWDDLFCVRFDKDGAIVMYCRVLLGSEYCKGEREWL